LGPEAEERRWDGQNEVLQVGEHGVNRGGGQWRSGQHHCSAAI
jgi:hypothetical protein